VFDSRALRKIFGLKREEVTRNWRKLHNEKFNDFCSSPDIVQVIKSRGWAKHVACMRENRNAYGVLVEKHQEKGPLVRSRRR
jgi:hypothetical protein